MQWFTLSILAGLFYAFSRSISRTFMRDGGRPIASSVIFHLAGGLVFLPLLFFFDLGLPAHTITWVYFVLFTITGLSASLAAFAALKRIDVSLYQIVLQTSHVFVVIVGLAFFSEPLTIVKAAAIALIIIGVFTATYEKNSFELSSGVWLILANAAFGVAAFSFLKLATPDFPVIPFSLIGFAVISAISFALTGFSWEKVRREFTVNKKALWASGICIGLFQLFVYLALKTGEVSRVMPATNSSLIFGVLIGMLFLKEHKKIPQKILGVLVIAGGILLLNY